MLALGKARGGHVVMLPVEQTHALLLGVGAQIAVKVRTPVQIHLGRPLRTLFVDH
jgi:hypothetical protein